MLRDLASYIWDKAGVDWQQSRFAIPDDRRGRELHTFLDVDVCREDLEKWINGAMPDAQGGPQETAGNLTPKPSDKVAKPARRGGRKPGSGSYAAQDRVLWKEMKGVMDRGKAMSVWDAAGQFAEKAPGAAFDSKRRRLVKGYNNWIIAQ